MIKELLSQTNHLDLEAVVWLEAYLSTYNHILVITSHSADFMDSVCTNIVSRTSRTGITTSLIALNSQMDLTHDKKLLYVSLPCTSSSSDADVDFSTVVTTVSCTSLTVKGFAHSLYSYIRPNQSRKRDQSDEGLRQATRRNPAQ